MITINLRGFGEDRPEQVHLQANTYKEALEGLKQHPDFNPAKTQDRFVCKVDKVLSSFDLNEPIQGDEVTIRCEDRYLTTDKRFRGAGGDNGFVKIVIGVILIVAAIYGGGYLSAAASSASTAATISSISTAMIATGISLIAGGIAILLAPDPEEAEKNSESAAGKYPNTVKAGTVKALILGKHRWGGHLFSVNLENNKRKDSELGDFAALTMRQSVPVSRRDSWITYYFDAELGSAGRLIINDPEAPEPIGDMPIVPWQVVAE